MSYKKVIFCVLFLFLLVIPCRALDLGDKESELSAVIPDEIEKALPDGLFDGEFDLRFIYVQVAEAAKSALKGVLSSFFSVTGAVIIASVFRILRSTVGEGSLIAPIFDFVCGLAVALTVWGMLDGVWRDSFSALENLSLLMNGMSAVMTSLYISSGQALTAAVTNAGLSMMLTVMENCVRYLLYPALRVTFALTIVSAAGGLAVGELSKLVRSIFTISLSFIMAMMTLGLSCQTVLAGGADGVSARMIRFAAGSFVPVIGGAVSEAIKTVMGSLSYIKSTVGVIGIICVALTVLPIVLRIFAARIALAVSAAIARLLDCGHEADLIGECSALTNITLAAVISMSVMFIFMLTLMIKSGAVS